MTASGTCRPEENSAFGKFFLKCHSVLSFMFILHLLWFIIADKIENQNKSLLMRFSSAARYSELRLFRIKNCRRSLTEAAAWSSSIKTWF